MVKFSSTLQCKFCKRIFPSEVFSANLSVCTRDKGVKSLMNYYNELPLKISIIQTSIKEENKYKPYTVILHTTIGICHPNKLQQ